MSFSDQPTQQYPSLPPPNGGRGYPPAPSVAYAPVPYHGVPYGPVPVVPPSRGAGFWVGITAAIATGVILALLGGFFIGRGTRLSSTDVQAKVTAQAQADQIAQQQALSAQKAADQTALNRAVANARRNGEAAGFRQGRIQGQAQGYQTGQAQGFQQGQQTGQAQGFGQGQRSGQRQGYQQGLTTGCLAAGGIFCP